MAERQYCLRLPNKARSLHDLRREEFLDLARSRFILPQKSSPNRSIAIVHPRLTATVMEGGILAFSLRELPELDRYAIPSQWMLWIRLGFMCGSVDGKPLDSNDYKAMAYQRFGQGAAVTDDPTKVYNAVHDWRALEKRNLAEAKSLRGSNLNL